MENEATVAAIQEPNADIKQVEDFKFSGQAGEFFGIQFVNNILVMMTLGLYSPWAKVRTMQYFYGNTELANSNFQFTADPAKMLGFRIIALLLFLLYIVSENLGTQLANIVLVCFFVGYFLLAPILTIFIMSFRLRHSAWRGIHFRFHKNFREAYKVYSAPLLILFLAFGSGSAAINYSSQIEGYLGIEPYEWPQSEAPADDSCGAPAAEGENESGELPIQLVETADDADAADADELAEDASDVPPVAADVPSVAMADAFYFNPYLLAPAGGFLILFLLLLPYFDFINMRFLSRNTHFGTSPFVYRAEARDYYRIYSRWLVVSLLFAAAWAIPFATDWVPFKAVSVPLIVLSVLYIPMTRAYLSSRRYNLLFGKTVVGDGHRIRASLSAISLFWIIATNSLAVILSFGLMSAWAKVRVARYILQNTALEVNGSLDSFIAGEQEKSSALAEEIGDAFDLELSL